MYTIIIHINDIQGVFIFVLHVIRNKQVNNHYLVAAFLINLLCFSDFTGSKRNKGTLQFYEKE